MMQTNKGGAAMWHITYNVPWDSEHRHAFVACTSEERALALFKAENAGKVEDVISTTLVEDGTVFLIGNL